MEDLFGCHSFRKGNTDCFELCFGENKITVQRDAQKSSCLWYRRYDTATSNRPVSEAMMLSQRELMTLGVFPVPALLTPKSLARYIYLKFKSPVIIEQRSAANFYTIMPIEIAVYRQHEDEEIIVDAFSTQRQHYSLYGTPENGVICRYKEVDISSTEDNVKPVKYKEALVRIRIRNEIDNVVKINQVIIPMFNVILDHNHDESILPGIVEMNLDQAFGKDIVNVRLVGTKVKRLDKTSVAVREDSLTFLMDAGY